MEGIGFTNMKVFKEHQWFDFNKITLLTGTNNSGKSSIINAMQMLQDNLKNKNNLDELIQTKFKLTTNQKKYGSIANFVNYESNSEQNYFAFTRKIKNIKYDVKIEINKALESYGSVKAVVARDLKTNSVIFEIHVDNPYPDYKCSFKINYKYFIDNFNKKCENTELLRKRIVDLDNYNREVNSGKKTLDEFREFADKLSKELSVYIHVDKEFDFGDTNKKVNCRYSIENNDLLNQSENQKVDTIGVFFTENFFGEKKIKLNDSFIEDDKYNQLFKPSYMKGLFDFSQLWDKNPEIEIEFKNIICSFYKNEYDESYKLLCDDLIILLSNNIWEMKENYSSEFGEDFIPFNLTRDFIDSLSDFGIMGSMFSYINSEDNRCYIKYPFIHASINSNNDSKEIKKLMNEGFRIEVLHKIAILFDKFKQKNNSLPDQDLLISEAVYEEIHSDIIMKIYNLQLDFHNDYVSSNRFMIKRTYNFNDNTDFTNFLKKLEYLIIGKEECFKFINKWIKEFKIAEELTLKEDDETGNFKAYLKNSNKETPLADFGLGTNQLLPIIFSLALHFYDKTPIEFIDKIAPRTVVIEEPEANLHPAMQSKLADLFVDAANKFEVQIIAETHSEYLIRKMQYLVAKESFKENDEDISIANDKVNIYYVNSEIDELGRKAYEINFKNNGQLTESFGKGFIDETSSLQFELYKLNNAQSN